MIIKYKLYECKSEEDIRLIPDILENNGQYFFPVFTTMEDMGEYGNHFSKIEKHLLEAIMLAKNNERDIAGIVINAFSDPFILDKDLFEERGQKTPYEIWKANPNDWTWTKLREVAKSMTYGTGTSKTYGLSVMNSKPFMLSTGKDFVNIAGNNITNTSKDGDVKKAWKFINDMLDVDKSIDRANSAITDLINRKAAMLVEGQHQMQSENTLNSQMKDAWGVAPFPKADGASKYYTPVRACLWGIGKGAKNSAAAAEFLKYWLDIANEETKVYANEECREVHAWMWEQAKGVDFSSGVLNFGGNTTDLTANLMGGSENVDSVIDANFDAINADIAAVLGEVGN